VRRPLNRINNNSNILTMENIKTSIIFEDQMYKK